MYIFLDESGSLHGKKNNVFVVGGFITNNPKRTAKSFRKWQHRKFTNKKLRYRAEVKFTDTRFTEEMRLKTLQNFIENDIRIFYSFLKTANIPLQYRRKGSIETGLLYAEIVGQSLRLLLPTTDLGFRVFRDFRHLKGIPQTKFNESIRLGLAPNLSAKTIIQTEAVDSSTNANIQIADWVCGALFRYYNRGKNGERYFVILKSSIIASEELFKDYWQSAFHNKKPPFE